MISKSFIPLALACMGLLLPDLALARIADGQGAKSRVTDDQDTETGVLDTLSPAVTSCAGIRSGTNTSVLIPCEVGAPLCQPNFTSTTGTCSVSEGDCRGQSETLTGFVTVTSNDGCGNTDTDIQDCQVSCPCVENSNTRIWEGSCTGLDQNNGICGTGTRQVGYRNNCGFESQQTESCSVDCPPPPPPPTCVPTQEEVIWRGSGCINLNQQNGTCGTGQRQTTVRNNCGSEWTAWESCSVGCPQEACYAIRVVDEGSAGMGSGYSGNYPQCAIDELNEYMRYYNDGWGDDEYINDRMHNNDPNRYYESYVVYINDNCDRIESPTDGSICQEGRLGWRFSSPISLIWTPAHTVEGAYTLTTFPLDPKSPAGQKYEWRGSSDAPLVVWDPAGKRMVTDATQLFGNHTFGKAWKHGYEPLATLDTNSDRRLSGDELQSLALWFDANKNGISEPGEVRGMAESGVVNIYVTPDRTDPKTGFVHAAKGYDRTDGQKLVTLPSVDWFARAYSGAGAAVAAGALSGTDTPVPASSSIRTPYNTPVGTPNWKDALTKTQAAKASGNSGTSSAKSGAKSGGGGASGGGGGGGSGALGTPSAAAQPGQKLAIAGTWLWAHDPAKPSVDRKVGDGILVITNAGDGIIEGVSIIELSVESNRDGVARVAMRFPLKGTFEGKTDAGEEAYRFLVIHPETGQVTRSTALLSADGKTLTGKSTSKTNQGDLKYEWTAIRMSPQQN